MVRQKLIDGHQVANRLGHLFAAKLEHAVVHPETGKLLAGKAFGLGNLILMVRKDQVISAAVDVNLLTVNRTFNEIR